MNILFSSPSIHLTVWYNISDGIEYKLVVLLLSIVIILKQLRTMGCLTVNTERL